MAGILAKASSQSIALTKRLLLDVVGPPLDRPSTRRRRSQRRSRSTDDCKHGIAYFLEHKKPPTWR